MALSSDPSAWRNLREPRIWTRPIGRPRKNEKLDIFYGYPAELVAEWYCVAISTAHVYKTGRLTPSKPAAKLFRLHRDRMVPTRKWRAWFMTRAAQIGLVGLDKLHNLARTVRSVAEALQTIG